MPNTSPSHERSSETSAPDKQAAKPAIIRMKLKDKEYRRLCELAQTRGCAPEELVERCVQELLES